ncbi:MAG: TetR family transcriptional regulator [Alphaproteobacteria bacterium HGW-Alphaproteobacteria-2]|nr:MAG: TetR family transcriptional regulator [Alphaproteobacteria bacterium HGW-Alphaproteobacteria-2]
MEQHAHDGGWRGSPDLWLGAAQEALLEGGIEAVKILPLAQRLKLSRTSFYWFFKSRESLLDGVLARWREKNTGNLVRRAEAYAETAAEAMLNVIDCWLDSALFDARFEFAVRSWALSAPDVLAQVHRADEQRLDALAAMLKRFGEDGVRADVRARAIYLTQIGYISIQAEEDLATRMARIPAYVEIFTGRAPSPRELARFHARHGFPPT